MQLRKLILLLGIILPLKSIGQKSTDPTWSAEYSKSKSFIENLGQFDDQENNSTGKILYAIDFGATRIFFGNKGVSYSFLETTKIPKEKRDELRGKMAEYPTERKKYEKLVGKFLLKTDEVNMVWDNASTSVQLIGQEETSDYHNYSYDNGNGEIVGASGAKGFKKLIYKNLYPGIDVEYLVHPEIGVKYAVIVHPGADPSAVKMIYDKDISLLEGKVQIPTQFGNIVDHEPYTFYENDREHVIPSNFKQEKRTISFDLGNYDNTRTLIIDPWTQTPAFNTNWEVVWECERDGSGNVYILGGIMPLQVLKYSNVGALLWTYSTPYDTSNCWLGTLATDLTGNSYVTRGSVSGIQKISTTGSLLWNNNGGGGSIGNSDEYWSIEFNCDQSGLVVGGTTGAFAFLPVLEAAIYNINTGNGNINNTREVAIGPTFSFPPNLQEVRSIAGSPNGKYYFLTQDTIGFISDNFNLCSGNTTDLLKIDNGMNLGYKSENYRYDNTGICALAADENALYVNRGNQLQKRSLLSLSVVSTVTIPNGGFNSTFGGNNELTNSGIAIDDCGNIYVGSTDGVYKFNSALVQQAFYPTSFKVYDVDINSLGEIIACGGTGDYNSGSRAGGIQSFAASACAPIALTCCDASFCFPTNLCANSSPIQLTAATLGGTWSGVGINASGIFDPVIAGIGTHPVTYTLGCGTETISILVGSCSSLQVCEETNGNMTVTGGSGPYTWTSTVTTSTTSNDCATCGGIPFFGSCLGPTLPCTITNTSTVVLNGSTVTLPANTTSVSVTDNGGTTFVFDPNIVAPCTSSCPTISVSITSQTNVACFGQTNGSATVSASGGSGTYTYTWSPGNLNGGTQTGLAANVYTVNVVDANLCPGSTTVNITEPAAIAVPTASVTIQPTCSVASGTIAVTAPAPAAGVTYTVSGTAPVVAAQTNSTGVFSGLATGVYSVITTVNGCTSTATSLTVNVQPVAPAAPTASVTSQPTCITPTGTITATLPAPSGGVTFTVTGAAPIVAPQTNTTGVFDNLAVGNYTITTTINGCTSAATPLIVTAAVGAPAPPTANIIQPTCSISTGNITATLPIPAAGTTYTLTGSAPVVAAQTNATGVFNDLASGDYTLLVTVSGCSSSPTPLTINAQPATPSAPALNTTQPTCNVATGSIEITVTGIGASYTVTGTLPIVNPQTNATGIFTGLASGDYSVTTTVGGCTSAPTLVTVNTQPTAPAAPTASITAAPTCVTPTGTITVTIPTPTAGTTYSVTGTSPIVSAQTNSSGVFNNLAVGTYEVTSTVNGCTSTASLVFISPPAGAPTLSLVSSTDVSCFGDTDGTAEVSGTGGTGTLTYAWSPSGGSSASATGLAGGDYTVTVTDGAGCSTSLLLTISEPDQIVITDTETDVICGSSQGQISTSVTGGDGTYTYSWAPNGEITSSLSNLNAGSYLLTVTDGNACSVVENYSIVNTGSLSIIATPASTTIAAGETVQLNAIGASSYVWTPSTGLSCTDCPDPIASPITTTTYTVTGSANGCTGSAQLNIFVPIICGDLYVPTVFSPNSDGPDANDILCVMGSCIAELNYAVYNRWGEKVFETTDKTICWNGFYKDKPVNSGVYAYRIYAVLFDGSEIEESGNLTIVR